MSKETLVCIVCPNGCALEAARLPDGTVQCSGNRCKRGADFAAAELTRPMRTLTTTVRTAFPALPLLPVRTAGEIERARLRDVMRALTGVVVDWPARCGDVIVKNAAGTGCDVIATLDIPR